MLYPESIATPVTFLGGAALVLLLVTLTISGIRFKVRHRIHILLTDPINGRVLMLGF